MYIIGVWKMLTTTITKLRNELPKYLHYVEFGEHIIVTSHGKPIARIIPPLDAPREAKNQLKQLRKTCHIGDVVSPIQADWDAES